MALTALCELLCNSLREVHCDLRVNHTDTSQDTHIFVCITVQFVVCRCVKYTVIFVSRGGSCCPGRTVPPTVRPGHAKLVSSRCVNTTEIMLPGANRHKLIPHMRGTPKEDRHASFKLAWVVQETYLQSTTLRKSSRSGCQACSHLQISRLCWMMYQRRPMIWGLVSSRPRESHRVSFGATQRTKEKNRPCPRALFRWIIIQPGLALVKCRARLRIPVRRLSPMRTPASVLLRWVACHATLRPPSISCTASRWPTKSGMQSSARNRPLCIEASLPRQNACDATTHQLADYRRKSADAMRRGAHPSRSSQ